MKAMVMGGLGLSNLALRDVSDPKPGPGQVLVRMRAASLNFRDLLTLDGKYGSMQDQVLAPRQILVEGGELAAARLRLAGVSLIAATDVEHPLLGPHGSARVFGPQKGADPPTVQRLEHRLKAWSEQLDAAVGRPVSQLPGAGAAGGLGAALLALGARRESGAVAIAERTGLADALGTADLVVTGEGRLDEQSPHGKVVGNLARVAGEKDVPVLVLAGQVTLDHDALAATGITAAYSVATHAGSVHRAITDATRQLASLASRVAADFGCGE